MLTIVIGDQFWKKHFWLLQSGLEGLRGRSRRSHHLSRIPQGLSAIPIAGVQLSDRPQGKIELKVISWNLLRLVGAAVEDVAVLMQREQPDLLLMQEATEEMETLPHLIGGYFHWEPLPGRIHGLAAWSPHPLPPPQTLPLPVSRLPGRLPPRIAQIIRLGDITIANVHLSHGQLLNRRQLLRVIRTVEGPAAVIGDYNAIGPTLLRGFKDVGPREPTHVARNVLRFRLDRCLVRGLNCVDARALERGPSDHRPIALDLATA